MLDSSVKLLLPLAFYPRKFLAQMSSARGLNLKPVKLDPSLVELLESNSISSCVCLDSSTFLVALSSGEVFKTSSMSTRLKFSTSLLSSVLPESLSHSSGHRASSGFLSAAVAAVGLGSGGGAAQSLTKLDVSRLYKIDKTSAIVSCNNGDNYYVNMDVGIGYLIGGSTGVITAVAPIGTSCLIGTQTGKIFLLNASVSKKGQAIALIDTVPLGACKLVYELPGTCRVTDIVFSDSVCFVSTANCLYSCSSKSSSSKLFASGSAHLVWESPISFIGSRVSLHTAVPELVVDTGSKFTHVSWLNGACIVTSTIADIQGPSESRNPSEIRPHTTSMGGHSLTQKLISKPGDEVAKKIPNLGDFFAVFDYFFVVLFESKMIAISRILPATQYVYQITTNSGTVPSYGVLHGTHGIPDLVFSAKRIYSVMISNEKFDVWRYFLRRKNFTAAIASVDDDNTANKAFIYKAEADNVFTEPDKVDVAGELYAKALLTDPKTISPFVNEIISKLSVNRKSLLKFLLTKLDSIGKDDDDTDEGVIQVQVSVLFIYIASLFVEELANRKDEDSDDIEIMFVQFVQDRYHSLNSECIKAVYELLETSGLFSELIMVAETVGDTDKAIRVDMETGNYLGIIRRLSLLPTTFDEDMLIKIAPVLFRFNPSEFIDLLIKKRKYLSPDKFLNSVISFSGSLTRDHKQHVVRYLEFRLLEDGSVFRGESLMNVLIELKCLLVSETKPVDESSVMHLLETISNRNDFCPEFSLRVFRHYGLTRSEILLLAINGEYLKATKLALNSPDLELAKEVAWRSRSRSIQKICWMAIIETIGEVQEMVKIFQEAEVLDVVDLVTILNNRGIEKLDGVLFQEICEKLKTFDDTEKSLESEIGNYCEALELIRSDLRSSRMNACTILSHSQKCEVCLKLLYNEQFIVFNLCGHCFHNECLKDVMTMRLMNKKSQTDIDETICESCVLCGDNSLLLETLFSPFVDVSLDAAELEMWTIKGI